MSFLLLQTGGADNLLTQDASNLLLQDSGAAAATATYVVGGGVGTASTVIGD